MALQYTNDTESSGLEELHVCSCVRGNFYIFEEIGENVKKGHTNFLRIYISRNFGMSEGKWGKKFAKN